MSSVDITWALLFLALPTLAIVLGLRLAHQRGVLGRAIVIAGGVLVVLPGGALFLAPFAGHSVAVEARDHRSDRQDVARVEVSRGDDAAGRGVKADAYEDGHGPSVVVSGSGVEVRAGSRSSSEEGPSVVVDGSGVAVRSGSPGGTRLVVHSNSYLRSDVIHTVASGIAMCVMIGAGYLLLRWHSKRTRRLDAPG